MTNDLDRHASGVDSSLDGVDRMLEGIRDRTNNQIEDMRDEIERQRDVLDRMGHQDFVKGLRDIERHYNTDYDTKSDARQAENDIDATFVRHGYDMPFEDVGLSRVDVDDSAGFDWFADKVTTRRAVLAGAATAIGGLIGTDFFNSFEGDHPGTGGVRFGQDDIDGWGAMEDPRAGYMSSPPCDKTDEEVRETLDLDAEVSDTFYELNGEDLDVYVFQDGLLDYKGSMDYRGSLEGVCQ
ncbi:hypothetical protein [Candidatus Nanohalococcus occultus]|uniref:Uncharacterized protein n=1 Tax=Candidatus Nanohalococcus occultus TaxID=2978047 RepID=A0ABY8CL42_9ARCH|nr:hypothetical protein SVXNc_1029 [Candidatus Nanohaloarchaeota archaeon SVXNc]